MPTTTTNYGLTKDATSENYDVIRVNANMDKIDAQMKVNADAIDAHKTDYIYQTAGGTGTAITLTISETLVSGLPINFIASANNSAAATTINGKSVYKPNTTTAPNIISGKPYTVVYNLAGDCFFLKASAEGDAVVGDVLAGKKFSNDSDTGLTGTMTNQGSKTYTPSSSVQSGSAGYYSGITVNAIPSTYKKYASGNYVVSSGNSFTISGLTFQPRIVVWTFVNGTKTLLGMDNEDDSTGYFMANADILASTAPSMFTQTSTNRTLTSTGGTFKTGYATNFPFTVYWWAFA